MRMISILIESCVPVPQAGTMSTIVRLMLDQVCVDVQIVLVAKFQVSAGRFLGIRIFLTGRVRQVHCTSICSTMTYSWGGAPWPLDSLLLIFGS